MQKDKVIFRRWRDGGILALFPDISAGGGFCQSYEHIGQHGGADYRQCIKRTSPASPKEYADLAKELSGMGYKLDIKRRK